MIKANLHNTKQKGAAMLLATIFFLAIATTIVLGIAVPIIKQVKIGTDTINSVESYYLSEGALQDGTYRVLNSKSIASGDTYIVNGYTTTITLTTTASGKIVEAYSSRNGLVRKTQAVLSEGIGAAFNYGVQVGVGGFYITGGSSIAGNVYSNGSIKVGGGSTITGGAIAANPPATTTDQSNNSPLPISSCTSSTCVTFGNSGSTQDMAQSFYVSNESPLNSIAFYLKKVSTPGDITVKIVADNAGKPGSTIIMSGTVSASSVTTNFGWATSTFPTYPILDPAQKYWMVLDAGSNASRYYMIGANTNGYNNGSTAIGTMGGTWASTTPATNDIYFQLFLGGGNSYIGNATPSYVGEATIGTGGVGDAWAYYVGGATVSGNLYCQLGAYNNKSCNTGHSLPTPSTFPMSDAVINQFKSDVDAATPDTYTGGWTYNGNLTINYLGTSTTSLRQVNGNLTLSCNNNANFTDLYVTGTLTVNSGCQMNADNVKVDGNATINNDGATIDALEVGGNLTVTSGGVLTAGPVKVEGNASIQSTFSVRGTVWVVGNLTLTSGGTVRLNSSYGTNSGTIVADGYLDLSGGGTFGGSGQTGSYVVLLTTSNCPVGAGCGTHNAIDLSGGAGAVVVVAQNGTLKMSGGTSAKAMVSNRIEVSGGGQVQYESGLANLNFSSGPSGGWDITSWKEVQ